MNIFDINLEKIKKIIIEQNKKGLLELPENLDSINVDMPPEKFDSDISTNVAMILSKVNNSNPLELAKIDLILKIFVLGLRTFKCNLANIFSSSKVLVEGAIVSPPNEKPRNMPFSLLL